MTVRGSTWALSKAAEPALFVKVQGDLIARMWNSFESTKQWQIYYSLVEIMPESVVRLHKIHGDKLTLFRRQIEDLTGHYAIITIEDWAEASEGLPEGDPYDLLWDLASTHSWPA